MRIYVHTLRALLLLAAVAFTCMAIWTGDGRFWGMAAVCAVVFILLGAAYEEI